MSRALLGVVLGVAAGLLPILLGTAGALVAAVFVLLFLVTRPGWAAVSGIAAGFGAVWLYGTYNTHRACQPTTDLCADFGLWPIAALSAASFAFAVFSAAMAVRNSRLSR
jgi:hypothetical protein